MNERIKQLMIQATEYANEQNELHGVGYVITFKEKFAESIVRECMNIVGDGTVDGEIYHDRIKHHFGVKE